MKILIAARQALDIVCQHIKSKLDTKIEKYKEEISSQEKCLEEIMQTLIDLKYKN